MNKPFNNPKAEARYQRRLAAMADPFAHLPLGLRPQAVMARLLGQTSDATEGDNLRSRLEPESVVARLLAASGR